ncbi:hypothetical protein ACHAXR_004789 [Thalassiosira sp. AJA248-18]
MTPFSKPESSQSDPGTALMESQLPLHQHSNQSLDHHPPDAGSSRTSSPLPPQSTAVSESSTMSKSPNNNVDSRSCSNGSTNSEDTQTPFLVNRGSEFSIDSPSTKKVQHPLTDCLHRHEPHPSYQTPHHQHNCRLDAQKKHQPNPSLPTLPFHSHQELSLAKRSIKKLVMDSQFFPPSRRSSDLQKKHQPNPSLPTLPFHSHQELSLAERSIKKLVMDSQFFPPPAANDNWFTHSCGDGIKFVPLHDRNSDDEVATAEATTHVTTLYEHEIRVEGLLGRGGFCEVRLAYLEDDISNNNASVDKRSALEETSSAEHQCYAIKYLSPTIIKRKSKKAFSRGAADLAIEARFLSLLSHENIIRLHYVSAGSLYQNYNCWDANDRRHSSEGSCTSAHDSMVCQHDFNLRRLGYFLVLDHLHSTLDHRTKHSFIPEVVSLTGESPGKHHENHRCCTTTNIVCQQRRKVTSTSCNGCQDDDAVYKLTGRTGSRRYMSPEVAFSKPYNYKADTYSFGVLLYEIATLMQPFYGFTIERHEIEVLRRGYRPCLVGYNNIWPKDLACLIEDCWSGDMRDRPSINEVMERLDCCINELTTPVATSDATNSKISARSILVGISQLQLPPQKETPAPPSSSSARSSTDDQCCKGGKNKMKQFFGPRLFL